MTESAESLPLDMVGTGRKVTAPATWFPAVSRPGGFPYETLLHHEFAHRLGKQLQILQSLLSTLASAGMNTEKLMLPACGYLISMIALNEALYKQTEGDRIEMQGYLGELSEGLESLPSMQGKTRLHIDCEPEAMPMELALTLGLTITEMIALRFRERRGIEGLELGLLFRRSGDTWIVSLSGNDIPAQAPIPCLAGSGSPEANEEGATFSSYILSRLLSQMQAQMISIIDRERNEMLLIPIPLGWD